jgi:hypothetical protein
LQKELTQSRLNLPLNGPTHDQKQTVIWIQIMGIKVLGVSWLYWNPCVLVPPSLRGVERAWMETHAGRVSSRCPLQPAYWTRDKHNRTEVNNNGRQVGGTVTVGGI